MRSAEFDREKVLRSAMDAFISKGYSKTSMQDLKKATGLHPGSIYCAFENKRGLLVAALNQYRLERNNEFMAVFDSKTTVMEGLEAYLDSVVEECERAQIKHCLLQKALNELADQDEEVENIISKMLNDWQQAFTEKLRQAQQDKEISEDKDCEELSQFLVMGIYGIRTFSYTHPVAGSLGRLSQQLLTYIRS
ncbi:TetR family transcriptional regulator C-terminal domain-containing protein [Vibrio sp. YMD68]|uniref:TetR/AcrR family transcriptional regulator n=1 Tax=Vibrio sp. YMD68 TaxID=3042300 RepID=UPI00249C069E|nr:TetR/AcrR family transcriptional regulator [Vibrio sp. YMD68]WGV98997.1 TetR family transcriptional regulator C-terminal domain-containing protein [Vibrio sp. YMD68]